MKRTIIIILLALVMFGTNINNLPAKKKIKKYAFQCQVLVADSGGDFTSIQDAIDYVNPEPAIPCTILVAAGNYTENIQINKSYIHLKGSGSDRTFLQPLSNNPIIALNSVNDVKVSGFAMRYSDSEGIRSVDSSFTIESNEFVENDIAIYLAGGRNIIIEKNVFDHNVSGGSKSISIKSSEQVFVSNNSFIGGKAVTTSFEVGYGNITTATITGNSFINVDPAIDNNADRLGCSTRIVGNMITGEEIIETGIRNSGPAVISENTIEKCLLFAILNYADQVVISNNLLRENKNPIGAAISTSDTSTITGNMILNNEGHGVKIIGGVATVNGNTFINNDLYGVDSSAGSAIIMGNSFVNNNSGCINYGAGTVVAANLCENTLSVYGTITSAENFTIEAAKDVNLISSGNLNLISGANLDLRGSKIYLNSTGVYPAARLGDTTDVKVSPATGEGSGRIVDGSNTVFIGD